MSSPIQMVFVLGAVALGILAIVLGCLLLRSRARWAGVCLIAGGISLVISRAVWVVVVISVQRASDFSHFERYAPIVQGTWGMGTMLFGAGLLLLVLHFRAQAKRMRELEELSSALASSQDHASAER